MGEIVQFPSPEGGKEEEKKTEPLSQEEFSKLINLSEGLKRLYPSQVKEVKGVIGTGEKHGREKFVVGLLVWEHYKYPSPLLSSFVALFRDDELEKISFLEAKNNYWDWRTLVKTHKDKFHTEELLSYLVQLKDKFTRGEL